MTAAFQLTPTHAHIDLAEWRSLRAALGTRYRLIEQIGRGGMCTVYLARDVALERIVAIKALRYDVRRAPSSADSLSHFRREAHVQASMSHPHIVAVHAYGEENGVAWMVMDYATEGSLASRLDRGEKISIDEATDILVQLANALSCAHARGVVHGDVKPENVLIARDGRVLLTDFGVATVRTSDHSRSEIVRRRGTPTYMSPEQLAGAAEMDGRSDLYSLGVLAYRLLAGRLPFTGDATSVVAQHMTKKPSAIRSIVSQVPTDLAAIVERCIEKRPAARWESAEALAAALKETTRRSSWMRGTVAAMAVVNARLRSAAAMVRMGAAAF